MKRTLNSKENTRLVKWLKDTRLDRGLSTEALGKILGSPHTLVSKIERQERRLDVIEYITYCYALNINPSDGLTIATSRKNSWLGK